MHRCDKHCRDVHHHRRHRVCDRQWRMQGEDLRQLQRCAISLFLTRISSSSAIQVCVFHFERLPTNKQVRGRERGRSNFECVQESRGYRFSPSAACRPSRGGVGRGARARASVGASTPNPSSTARWWTCPRLRFSVYHWLVPFWHSRVCLQRWKLMFWSSILWTRRHERRLRMHCGSCTCWGP